jgi:hypothetical protein
MTATAKFVRRREIALDQRGPVTAKQAIEQGVSHAELSTMVARYRLVRVAHDVCRVPQMQAAAPDGYQHAVLWSGVPDERGT